MNRKAATVLKRPKASEFEIPEYLRTSWTSIDNTRFSEVLRLLKESLSPDDKEEYTLGFNEVSRRIQTDSMRILCVIACVDTGGDLRSISNLCRDCFSNGIAVIIGRGCRQLGAVFGKNRVCCVSLSKSIAAKPELLDLIINLSSLSSEVKIPLEESEEFLGKFSSRIAQQPTVKRKPSSEPKPALTPPVPKKVKMTPKKANFFTSFD